MLMNDLFHVAIKTPNLEATRSFYCDVLGMTLEPDMQYKQRENFFDAANYRKFWN